MTTRGAATMTVMVGVTTGMTMTMMMGMTMMRAGMTIEVVMRVGVEPGVTILLLGREEWVGCGGGHALLHPGPEPHCPHIYPQAREEGDDAGPSTRDELSQVGWGGGGGEGGVQGDDSTEEGGQLLDPAG